MASNIFRATSSAGPLASDVVPQPTRNNLLLNMNTGLFRVIEQIERVEVNADNNQNEVLSKKEE